MNKLFFRFDCSTIFKTSHNIDFATLNVMNYSTTEKNTGMTWVDGRKIYRKTISMGGGSNVNKRVNHGIANLRRVVRFEGQGWDGNVSIPIQFTTTTNSSIQIYVSSTQVCLSCNFDRDNLSEIYVTLYYTKTTN